MRRIWLYLLPLALIQPLFAQLPDYYKRVDRITWVVEDVDKVVQGWRKLGFEQIHEPTLVSLDHVRFRGSPARSKVRVAAGRLGAARIRWIQPVSGKNAYSEFLARQRHGDIVYEWILPLKGPTVYQEYLKAHGEGFHHLAFDTEDIDRVTARWKDLGFPPVQSGAWGEAGNSGSGRFSYFDTTSIGGVTIEFLWNHR
jgi:hypothetical protein